MAEDLRRQQDVFQQAVPQTVKRIPKAKTLEMHGFLCRFDAMARQKKPDTGFPLQHPNRMAMPMAPSRIYQRLNISIED